MVAESKACVHHFDQVLTKISIHSVIRVPELLNNVCMYFVVNTYRSVLKCNSRILVQLYFPVEIKVIFFKVCRTLNIRGLY